MDNRVERIREYFRSGEVVCPFAKMHAEKIDYAVLPGFKRADIGPPLLGFVRNTEIPALVYVFDTDMPNHEESRERVNEFFISASRVLYLDFDGEPLEGWIEGAKQIREMLAKKSNRNPFLCYDRRHGMRMLFTIAMGPQYDGQHPRYAPHDIVVITRKEDVAAVDSRMVGSIRAEAHRRMGRSYDADEIYLPAK